jgi:hypothetical protein
MVNNLTADDLGPQCDGDDSFTRKARLFQSFYRLLELGEVCGYGPRKNSPDRYGNILCNGEETGSNFIQRSTFGYAWKRLYEKRPEETIDGYRLFNNMLSSMPLCFNLFHPLMRLLEKDEAVATDLVRMLFPDLPVMKVLKIDLEFVPLPIQDYLGDKTAMDAVIIFEDNKGSSYLLAIEVKYTDELGKNSPSNSSKHIDWATTLGMFNEEGLKAVNTNCCQVYRNFLLAEKYRDSHGLNDSFSIILSPAGNVSTEKEVASLKAHLLPGYHYKVQNYNMEDFINVLINAGYPEVQAYAEKFYLRYLDFDRMPKS